MGMIPVSLFGCIGLLVMAAVVAECVRAIWVALVMPDRPREAECGGCGYVVAGLASMTCPECGKDLRVAGINTRGLVMRYRGSTVGAVVAWSLLCGMIGFFGVGIFGMRVARQAQASATISARAVAATPQTWTTSLAPKSGGFKDVDVEVTMLWGTGAAALEDLKAILTKNTGEQWELAHDPAAGTLQITSPDGKQSTPVAGIGAGAANELFRAAGLNADSSLAAEATELDDVLKVLTVAPGSQPSQMNLTVFNAGSPRYTGGAAMPPPVVMGPDYTGLYLMAAFGAVALVWLAGVVGILMRRKRLMNETGQLPASA